MKVVVSRQLAEGIRPLLQPLPLPVELVCYDDAGVADGAIDDAEILIRGFMPAEVLSDLVERMPALRWMHIPRAGIDTSLVPAVMARELLITNSAGVHAVPIAEFVLMFMLAHAKRVPELIALQTTHAWRPRDLQLAELDGKTVLILGLGQIGQAIAARAKGFGMRVLGSRRSGAATPHVDSVVDDTGWRALLPEADYVVVAAPLTPQTRAMLGAAELAQMRPSAYLVNIARGEIVDEAALVEALHAGRIAGAGLDVFGQEPLPAGHPLWDAPNVFATPHISWSSPAIMPRTFALFVDNLQRYAAGQPLRNVIDKEAGY
jgi:phosphoglycerate dehydrogenase-like enzyme